MPSLRLSRGGRSGGDGAAPRGRKISLERALLISVVTVVVVLLLTGFALHYHYTSQIRFARIDQERANAHSAAGRLEDMLAHYREAVELIATEPGVVARFRSPEGDVLRLEAQRLRHLVPAAQRVLLLRRGELEPDSSLSPPFSYACVDLASQALEGGAVPMEVHRPGTTAAHVDLVRGVADPASGEVLGVVVVTLPLAILQRTLRSLRAPAYLELQQKTEGGRLTPLVHFGDASLKVGSPLLSIAVKGTTWQLSWWPAASVGVVMQEALVFWGAFAIAATLLAIVLYLLYRLISTALRRDQITIISILKDLQEGALNAREAQLTNCIGVVEQMQRMVRDLTVTPAGGSRPPSSSGEGEFSREDEEEIHDDLDLETLAPVPAGGERTGVAELPSTIFRAYDIRGIVGEGLTPDVVRMLGRAIGSEAVDRGESRIVVGYDCRPAADELAEALTRGLVACGIDVIAIGQVPTPLVWFAAQYLGGGSGVMVTGSHNPVGYSGLKIMLRGEMLCGDPLLGLRERLLEGRLRSGKGGVQTSDVTRSYLERITGDVRLERPMKVVVDCGNAVPARVAPQLLRQLGCEVVELFCEVDGTFPNHHPDPSRPENLLALTRAVTEAEADLGIAYDGDGDRLGVVDSEGRIIWPDRILMLLAEDVLLRQPGGKVIFDVKSSANLERVIREHGGEPLMWKSGYAPLHAKMEETGAVLAGELSGHIFFRERWFGFDDGIYASARLLEVLSSSGDSSARIFSRLPESVSTPELVMSTEEGEQYELMRRFLAVAQFPGCRVINLDGLRVEMEEGWGLVRASNTMPALTFRFEARNAEALGRIQSDFRQQFQEFEPALELPF